MRVHLKCFKDEIALLRYFHQFIAYKLKCNYIEIDKLKLKLKTVNKKKTTKPNTLQKKKQS